MKTLLLTLFFAVASVLSFAQQTAISGTIKDTETSEPVVGANIVLKGFLTGTVTDASGNFSLTTSQAFPLTLVVSSVGYERQEVELTESKALSISLAPKATIMSEMVVSASRVEESVLQSPVTIEKMDIRSVRDTPSINFYDGLQNMKGVEFVTSGLTYKQVNTRGFNTTGNQRFLQLIDGVDNQTPGLNFGVGNMFGSSDIDLESVEIIPGSASALYGPVAFNGVLMMRTKDPFMYQGLTVQAKYGMNHFGETLVNPTGMYDFSMRYAKAFNNKFAFKVNASYFSGLDWYATNYTDVDIVAPEAQRGDNNPGRNALNIYGDEVAKVITGIGRVTRTGYEERHLMDYDVNSKKMNAALHYRVNENMELIYQFNIGQGKASYTGSNRFSLNNFVLTQHRLEMKGTNYFVRGYTTIEDSHDSYNTRALGQKINQTWVRDLNGAVVPANQADNMWFNRYEAAFKGNVVGIAGGDHTRARGFADVGRYEPGSDQFNAEKERLVNTDGGAGAGVFSNSKLIHIEGQYDLTKHIKVFDLLVGGNYRKYNMFTNGTLMDDAEKRIQIWEGGAFAQVAKRLIDDKLKLTVSGRYDKNQNFNGRITPRASAVFTQGNHNFRASYQTGFRNPTPVDQYIKLNAGTITILGGVPDNSAGMNVYENSFTAASVGAFGGAVGAAIAGGTPPPTAIQNNKGLLVKSNVPYIKPERVNTFEVGYKGVIAEKLVIDANYYVSNYTDFILGQVVIRPNSPVLDGQGQISSQAAMDLNGPTTAAAFLLYTNAADEVSSSGATLGLTYSLPKNYTIGFNTTLSEFDIKDANPNNVPAFNTPKWRTNLTFGNAAVTKNFGFNVAWRWQQAFDWYGSFNDMRPGLIDSYSTIDAQVSYKVPSIKSVIKVGGNNILNNQVYQAYGSPAIGAIYYVSITFDELFR